MAAQLQTALMSDTALAFRTCKHYMPDAAYMERQQFFGDDAVLASNQFWEQLRQTLPEYLDGGFAVLSTHPSHSEVIAQTSDQLDIGYAHGVDRLLEALSFARSLGLEEICVQF
ncbi:hypothetical protein RM531_08410 [Salinisphaera sp. P385]|uniref:Uncharacterized protein n=1 Tax=Spectribacter acetivorans TaxID=3075603 RepID=A0ABU3B8K2_9GAMM|nr:hypothetical protein [Salinisphaera sp. P385]MDT0618498.1 hypothetical protein [Salinisphaera sp. P385]